MSLSACEKKARNKISVYLEEQNLVFEWFLFILTFMFFSLKDDYSSDDFEDDSEEDEVSYNNFRESEETTWNTVLNSLSNKKIEFNELT